MKPPHLLISPSYPYTYINFYGKPKGQYSSLRVIHYYCYLAPWYPPPILILLFPYLYNHCSKGHISALFKGFNSSSTPHHGLLNTLGLRLCMPINMIHEDIFNFFMYVVHGTSTPCAAESSYCFSNRKILEAENNLESIQ